MHLTRNGVREERGFTLIELLVSIVIVGIIAVPLSSVVIDYFRNTTTTSARMSESHDAQIANAYWQQDVASLGVRDAYDPATNKFPLKQSVGISFPCPLPAGSSTVITMAWTEYDATQISVAYVASPAGTSQFQLMRIQCTTPVSGASTVDSTATLAHYLSRIPDPPICSGTGGSSCTGSGDNVPMSISVTLNVADAAAAGQPYDVTLTGQRRQT